MSQLHESIAMKNIAALRPKKSFAVQDLAASETPFSTNDKAADKSAIDTLATEIAALQDIFYAEQNRKLLIVLQGMDTSGKDGTVKSVFKNIDPLGLRCHAFKAPSLIEKAHDFLWRVHQQVPAQGEVVIFNRSHYEDVLITQVHGWIDDAERDRRLAHIRDFERMLAETATVILKFFLHISKDEQRARLQARIDDPNKHWKFDVQDIEERKLWPKYQQAYTTAIEQTDADHAPWFVVPANSKTHRNLAIATVVKETLQSMKLRYPPAKSVLSDLKID